jgi:hypothetical protein
MTDPRLHDRKQQLLDPGKWGRCYKIADPLRPIGHTTTLCGHLVRKWCYDAISRELEPVWPPRHHEIKMGDNGIERTIRIIYDPDTHSIITRTVADSDGNVARNSLTLQRRAFLAVSKYDPKLRWMPDGGRFVQGNPEIACIPRSQRRRLIKREAALKPKAEI